MKRIVIIASLVLAACGPVAQKPPEAPETLGAQTPTVVATLGALAIDSAVARPPLGGQTIGVGYFTLRNTGEADRLLAASSPATSAIELHTHEQVDGMMRMRKVESVEAPAGGAVTFAPGGLHLMMFNFAPTGDSIPVTLTFEKGGQVTVPFKVMTRSAGDGETGHSGNEGHEH